MTIDKTHDCDAAPRSRREFSATRASPRAARRRDADGGDHLRARAPKRRRTRFRRRTARSTRATIRSARYQAVFIPPPARITNTARAVREGQPPEAPNTTRVICRTASTSRIRARHARLDRFAVRKDGNNIVANLDKLIRKTTTRPTGRSPSRFEIPMSCRIA